MKKSGVAKRYAKALIEIGVEEKRYKEIGKELRDAAAIVSSHPELKRFLLNPVYKMEDRQEIMGKVAQALKVSDLVKKLLSLLVENRGIAVLPEISAAYAKMEDELSGRVNASIESAVELKDSVIQEMRKRLQQATKKEIVLTAEKNAALIGGLVLRIGNTVFDGSIRTQLAKAKEKILEGVI